LSPNGPGVTAQVNLPGPGRVSYADQLAAEGAAQGGL
jgi:hypothetical protein